MTLLLALIAAIVLAVFSESYVLCIALVVATTLYYDTCVLKKIIKALLLRDILLHISIVGFVIALCGLAIDATEGRLTEILTGVGMITSIFVGLAALYVNEENDKKEKARAKAKLEEDNRERWESLVSEAEDKLIASNPCIVSLLPPRRLSSPIHARWEKDVYLGVADNRDEAFTLMRDYLSFNRITATDISELFVDILDADENVLESATMIRFTAPYSSVVFKNKLCNEATFLLRKHTLPKYDNAPSFDDWYVIDNFGNSHYYQHQITDEYAYRDMTRYLESCSAKVGDDGCR